MALRVSDAEKKARRRARDARYRAHHPEVMERLQHLSHKRRKRPKPDPVVVTAPEPEIETAMAGDLLDAVGDAVIAGDAGSEADPSPPASGTTAESTRAEALGIVAELEEVRERLRAPGLSNSDRATLRLRADVLSRLMIAREKLAKLPEPAKPDAWLSGYQGLSPAAAPGA